MVHAMRIEFSKHARKLGYGVGETDSDDFLTLACRIAMDWVPGFSIIQDVPPRKGEETGRFAKMKRISSLHFHQRLIPPGTLCVLQSNGPFSALQFLTKLMLCF